MAEAGGRNWEEVTEFRTQGSGRREVGQKTLPLKRLKAKPVFGRELK